MIILIQQENDILIGEFTSVINTSYSYFYSNREEYHFENVKLFKLLYNYDLDEIPEILTSRFATRLEFYYLNNDKIYNKIIEGYLTVYIDNLVVLNYKDKYLMLEKISLRIN
jgi:hypothetical protein